MCKPAIIALGVLALSASSCLCQQPSSDVPNAPAPQPALPSAPVYAPPTQHERLHAYLHHTYGIYSAVEAGARAGIDQATGNPSGWPEGAEGYGDRYGSAFGEIVVRGTTEYVIADAFREDIRFLPCARPCGESALTRAAQDTFTARKGEDGHRVFSVARFLGPVAGGAISSETWLPGTYTGKDVGREIGVNYGFSFIRNYLRELSH